MVLKLTWFICMPPYQDKCILFVRSASPIVECSTLCLISNLINGAPVDKSNGWIQSSSMPFGKTFNLVYPSILRVQNREAVYLCHTCLRMIKTH